MHRVFRQMRDIVRRPVCIECFEHLLRWKKAARCEYCLKWSAWNGKSLCPRCDYYKKKFGNPLSCEMCGCVAAFNKGPQKRAKLDEHLLCFTCTLVYKREKNNKRDEENKLRKGSVKRLRDAISSDSAPTTLIGGDQVTTGDAQFWHEQWQHVNDILFEARDEKQKILCKIEEESLQFESKKIEIDGQKGDLLEESDRLSELVAKSAATNDGVERDIKLFTSEKAAEVERITLSHQASRHVLLEQLAPLQKEAADLQKRITLLRQEREEARRLTALATQQFTSYKVECEGKFTSLELKHNKLVEILNNGGHNNHNNNN